MKSFCVHSFKGSEGLGSPQWLHFYPSLEEAHKSFFDASIDDHFDHSFIFLDSQKEVYVKWKNRAGNIQFCGSGAYALAWFLLNKKGRGVELKIISETQSFWASRKQNQVELLIPIMRVSEIRKDLFYNADSGIYFHQLHSPVDLAKTERIQDYYLNSSLENIHGFAAFYWSEAQKQGAVRYFCPWHGRQEDHVTGSIHQYLSPLVSELYGIDLMPWIQNSERGGQLISQIIGNQVRLFGECSLNKA